MSDEHLRELERLAKAGDSDAQRLLRVEQGRLGLRFLFPPRRKVRRGDRPECGWCPVCKQWSITRPSQKLRSRRKGKERLPTRFCTSMLPWNHPATGLLGDHVPVIGGLRRCIGPARYEDTRAPLEALEIARERLSDGLLSEIAIRWLAWFDHRIKVIRRKYGVSEPPKSCEHPSSRCDYVDGSRRRVLCKDCQVVFDPETGRVASP